MGGGERKGKKALKAQTSGAKKEKRCATAGGPYGKKKGLFQLLREEKEIVPKSTCPIIQGKKRGFRPEEGKRVKGGGGSVQ